MPTKPDYQRTYGEQIKMLYTQITLSQVACLHAFSNVARRFLLICNFVKQKVFLILKFNNYYGFVKKWFLNNNRNFLQLVVRLFLNMQNIFNCRLLLMQKKSAWLFRKSQMSVTDVSKLLHIMMYVSNMSIKNLP